jgi:hypothetical protein
VFQIPLTAVALKASLWTNLLLLVVVAVLATIAIAQYRSAAVKEGEGIAAGALAESIGKLNALQETLKRSDQIATQAKADEQTLLESIANLVERGRERIVVYRDRVKTLPPAACPPGQERMDATNGLLQ